MHMIHSGDRVARTVSRGDRCLGTARHLGEYQYLECQPADPTEGMKRGAVATEPLMIYTRIRVPVTVLYPVTIPDTRRIPFDGRAREALVRGTSSSVYTIEVKGVLRRSCSLQEFLFAAGRTRAPWTLGVSLYRVKVLHILG